MIVPATTKYNSSVWTKP